MRIHWWLGMALLALLVGGCKSSLRKTGEVKPVPPETVQTSSTTATQTPPPAQTPVKVAGYEVLTLEATLPPETMERAKAKGDCPRTFLMVLFDFAWSNPHGCVIGAITPKGLAEQAGLKTGDRIVNCNGKDVTCPSTLAPVILASCEDGKSGNITLTIYRPVPSPSS